MSAQPWADPSNFDGERGRYLDGVVRLEDRISYVVKLALRPNFDPVEAAVLPVLLSKSLPDYLNFNGKIRALLTVVEVLTPDRKGALKRELKHVRDIRNRLAHRAHRPSLTGSDNALGAVDWRAEVDRLARVDAEVSDLMMAVCLKRGIL